MESLAATGRRTARFIGQGFDTCEVPPLDALQVWITESPYRAVNLYIGGSGRACANAELTASLVARLAEIGWKFIPTWVGPQAPCYTGPKPHMSPDPFQAYAEGVAEAVAAVARARELGLTAEDGTGSIIYYDVERYDIGNAECHQAVRAFVSGWTGRLRATGNLAGVYGNGPTLSGLADLALAPDAIWAARWIHDSYTPDATVWDVDGLPNDLWANHQRIRQYTGGHVETWGGVSLNMDCDVIDGIVASLTTSAGVFTLYLPIVQASTGGR